MSCHGTQFQPMSRTWTTKRNLVPSNYNPFPEMGLGPIDL